ncbi:hypothetical protein [Streptomyces shenzhenensis]|uniref:hypothetical protein n=1 Tax=Streptomyces shenzhenensis TaxID=943815 RepID=UPI0015F0590D|nr:hypothetical protein [Streptomyces shenzhenensis]
MTVRRNWVNFPLSRIRSHSSSSSSLPQKQQSVSRVHISGGHPWSALTARSAAMPGRVRRRDSSQAAIGRAVVIPAGVT